MDKNTFWLYTEALPYDLNDIKNNRTSSTYDDNVVDKKIDKIAQSVSENILNRKIEVRNFTIADSGLGNDNRSLRERKHISKNQL